MKRMFTFLILSLVLLLRISFSMSNVNLMKNNFYEMYLTVKENRVNIEKINDKYPFKLYYSKISELEDGRYRGYFLIKNLKENENATFLELEKIKIQKIKDNPMKIYLDKVFSRSQEDLPFKTKNINKAILLGEDSISKELKGRIRYLGLSHIFAMSGLHIGLVFMMIYFFVFRIFNKKLYIELASLIFLSIYFFSVKESPSFTRAYIMLLIFIFGKIFYEKVRLKKSIYVSMYLSILLKPNSFLSLSFQLSYLAIFAIVYIYPFIKRINLKKIKILDYFLFTLSIQVFLVPIQVYYFKTLPFMSVFYNLVLAPIGTLYIILNYLILFLENFYLGFILYYPLKWFSDIFIKLIEIFSTFPYSTLSYSNEKLIYFYLIFFIAIISMEIKANFLEKN